MILHDQAIAPLVDEMMGATALAPHWTFSWPPLVFSARLAGEKQDATTSPLPVLSSSFFANFWRRFLTQICQCFTGVLPTPINQPQWCKWWCSFQVGGSCIYRHSLSPVLDSIVVSIPACHAGDRGSIPRRGGPVFFSFLKLFWLSLSSFLGEVFFFWVWNFLFIIFFSSALFSNHFSNKRRDSSALTEWKCLQSTEQSTEQQTEYTANFPAMISLWLGSVRDPFPSANGSVDFSRYLLVSKSLTVKA